MGEETERDRERGYQHDEAGKGREERETRALRGSPSATRS